MFEESNLDYGIIGNCISAALINKKDQSIGVVARFDSPSVFAKILDSKKNGAENYYRVRF